jgi:hypothetical protein
MTPLGAHSAGGSNVGLGIARPGCPLPLIEAPVSSDTPLNQRCSAGLRVTVRYAPSAGLGRGWGRRRLRQPDWRVKHEAVDFRRAGLRIYIRNKHLRRLRHFPPGRSWSLCTAPPIPQAAPSTLNSGVLLDGYLLDLPAMADRRDRWRWTGPPMPRSRWRAPLIQRLCRRHRLGVSPSRIMQGGCGWLVAGHNDCRGFAADRQRNLSSPLPSPTKMSSPRSD